MNVSKTLKNINMQEILLKKPFKNSKRQIESLYKFYKDVVDSENHILFNRTWNSMILVWFLLYFGFHGKTLEKKKKKS